MFATAVRCAEWSYDLRWHPTNSRRRRAIVSKTWMSSFLPSEGWLAIFSGGKQTAKHHAQATKEVPVAASTGHKAEVVKQNDE